MNILINGLSIQDSGGITVFDKLLCEIENSLYKFLIICNENENIKKLVNKYTKASNFEFIIIKNKGLINRLYFENIIFRRIIKEKEIKLIYNFSGSAQFFFKVPQITKVQNLLFYSKKVDKVYFQKKQFISWIKQIALKRVIFHWMIRQTKYIEVQSIHVKKYMNDFIDISKKQFFIKSDIKIDEELLQKPKKYDFSKKLKFLYIVGPHFAYLHKNFEDFVNAMKKLKDKGFNFEIMVTLTKEQIHNLILWDDELDKYTTFLGYISNNELINQFQDNTILISTSVIETLGLHVIEAIENGILVIAPKEEYCKEVYGNNILTYELFDSDTIIQTIKNITLVRNNDIKDMIRENQEYILKNENKKYQNILEIFDQIIKDNNV